MYHTLKMSLKLRYKSPPYIHDFSPPHFKKFHVRNTHTFQYTLLLVEIRVLESLLPAIQ